MADDDENGIEKKFIEWLRRPGGLETTFSVLKLVVAVAIGAVSSFVAAWSAIDARIEAVVSDRLGPYQKILEGNALNGTDENDNAADVFREVMSELSEHDLPRRTRDVLYDGMLYAAANSSKPRFYSPEVMQIADLMDVEHQIVPGGWRHYQVGWFALRTGDIGTAKKLFEQAEKEQGGDDSGISSGVTRGLLIVALCEGDSKIALEKLATYKERWPNATPSADRIVLDLRPQSKDLYNDLRPFCGKRLDDAVSEVVKSEGWLEGHLDPGDGAAVAASTTVSGAADAGSSKAKAE